MHAHPLCHICEPPANYTPTQIVPKESSRFGLPGDRENIVKLNADHNGICRFGDTELDQDNFELVQSNVKDLYEQAIKAGELRSILSSSDQECSVGHAEEELGLQARFARLRGG